MIAGEKVFAAARPAVLSLLGFTAVVLAFSTMNSFDDPGLMLILPVFLFLAPWFVLMFIAAVWAAWKRAWWRAAFLAFSLLTSAPVVLVSPRAGDDAHLMLMLPNYLPRIGTAHTTRFDWGLRGMFSGAVQRTLVHDPSDNLARLRTATSAWTRVTSVTWLFGHFYLVDEQS